MSQDSSHILYLEHFGLKEAPFKITPTTDFFYGGGQRGEILHALLYAINVGEGIMTVTGEVGSGKTMLLRTLIEKLPDNTDVIYIANPSLSGREILYNICEELGLHLEKNRPDTVRMLQSHLIEQYSKKRRVVAFIDEAQAMPDESLEEIRLLSNLETSRDKLLQIVLFGQPEFEEKIKQQSMRQLRERITVALKLKPFGYDDVREYISTRLRAAGYNGAQLFSNEACRLIAVVSQGLSRRINILADKALLSSYERGARTISDADARRSMRDINFGKMRYRSEQSRRISKQLTLAAGVVAVLLLVLAASVRLYDNTEKAAVPVTAAAEESADEDLNDSADTAAIAPEEAITATVVSPQTVIAVQQTVIETVIQTVFAEQSQQQTTAGNTQQDMLAAISQFKRGENQFSGEQLAVQLAENAEAHQDAPQAGGGENDWQAISAVTPEIIENDLWNWMPASSYLRSRLNATQTWLLQEGTNNRAYTARLLTVSQDRAVFLEKFLRYFSDFYPIRNVMVYPVRLGGGDKFVVTFGVYGNRQDAEVFIGNVPYYFTGGKPYAQQLTVSLGEAQQSWSASRQ